MKARYRGRVIHAVWQAKKHGAVLQVHEAARSIAEAAGSLELLDTVADELVREGVRQRAVMFMNHSSHSVAREHTRNTADTRSRF